MLLDVELSLKFILFQALTDHKAWNYYRNPVANMPQLFDGAFLEAKLDEEPDFAWTKTVSLSLSLGYLSLFLWLSGRLEILKEGCDGC